MPDFVECFLHIMHTDAQARFLFFACMAICVIWKSLSWVLLFFLTPACSLLMMLFSSMLFVSLTFIIFSMIFARQLIRAISL